MDQWAWWDWADIVGDVLIILGELLKRFGPRLW